eukprot:5169973-Prymnesium_polylepis.1
MLLTQGKTLDGILNKLRSAKQQFDQSSIEHTTASSAWIHTIHPEGRFRTVRAHAAPRARGESTDAAERVRVARLDANAQREPT